MTSTLLVTGASRGLGLEFVRQYLNNGWGVHACCRNPSEASVLQSYQAEHPKRLVIHTLDVCNINSINALSTDLKDVPIDILLNNAGVYGPKGLRLGHIPEQAWLDVFRTNCMGAFMMAQAFVEHVALSKKKIIATLSSEMASISENQAGGGYIYKSSKAALNAVMKSLAIDLLEREITVILLSPGWVKTRMGGDKAPLSAEDSVAYLSNLLSIVSLQESGHFLSLDGREIKW